MRFPTYEQALAAARRVGAAHADDAGQIAGLCDSTVQILCGAVAPRLVYDAAMKKGLSEFSRLLADDCAAIEALQ
ncbi:hypothetical protein [Mycolicibacterium fortuitum]|uniref:hypothetical protein n=1 Tax=Mycolicibacterium fortuitum TaxID=1766 RepID=UPI00260E0EFC|nr:hypothetical protein [Mycolicibacterium fortuitum]